MRSKYELKCDKKLKEQGWVTDWKVHPFRTPKGYSVDYFNRFDILAYKDGVLKCVAIKGHQGVSKELRQAILSFNIKKIEKEIWIFRRGKKEPKVEVSV